MDDEIWEAMNKQQRERAAKSGYDLSKPTCGMPGFRAEAVGTDGIKRYFIVSVSTKWLPVDEEAVPPVKEQPQGS